MNSNMNMRYKLHLNRHDKFCTLIYIFIVILFLLSANLNCAIAQEVQVQKSGGWMQTNDTQEEISVSQQPVQEAGQVQAESQPIGDIQEGEITFFDPDSIPESVPIPDADFAFDVPVNVQNLHSAVENIYIVCWLYGGSNVFTKNNNANLRGSALKSVVLQDGAYNGTVRLGVNEKDGQPSNVKVYECMMYLKLIGDSELKTPSGRNVETRALTGTECTWKTGRKSIPVPARYY